MRKTVLNTAALFCPMVILFLFSCASLGPDRGRTGRISQTDSYIEAGEYKKALDLFSAGSLDHPELKDKYLNAGNQIRNAADRAFYRGDFAKAGTIYNLLVRARITEQNFSGSLTFDGSYLGRQIKTCSKTLTEMGLMKYREEKLEEAISIWEKVLAFDHDNSSVINAVDTANRQLQALKNIQ